MREPRERPIYLDHHATTPVDPRVIEAVVHAMSVGYGNPNSTEHFYGVEASEMLESARREVAALVSARPEGVHLTSSSTAAIRTAVAHAVERRAKKAQPLRIVASRIEHAAVLNALAEAERAGAAELSWIPVDHHARLDMDALRRECRSGADLVCVMAANNEVGTIYDTRTVCELAAETGASTLIDATQAAGRVDLRFSGWGATYMVLSAHKMYGPKGAGALVTDAGSIPRSEGTPNVPAFAGLGEACRLRRLEMDEDEPAAAGLRDRLQESLLNRVPGLVINGDPPARLSHSLHVSVPDVPNDLVISLVRAQVALSTGSACHSGAMEPSHVLRAMGLSLALQEGALRMAVGKFNDAAEIDAAAEYLSSAIARARAVL